MALMRHRLEEAEEEVVDNRSIINALEPVVLPPSPLKVNPRLKKRNQST